MQNAVDLGCMFIHVKNMHENGKPFYYLLGNVSDILYTLLDILNNILDIEWNI